MILDMIDENTFIASDHHFGHGKLEQFEPGREIRRKELGFQTFEEMLIANHNAVVKPTDTVLFLGDFSFKNPQNYLHKLNGRKLLILGNHDRTGSMPYTGMEYIFNGVYIEDRGILLNHHSTDKHLSAVVKNIGNKRIMFSHYALYHEDTYNRQDIHMLPRIHKLEKLYLNCECNLNIHGHLHSKISDFSESINVCVEHLDYTPVKLGTLLSSL